jgi:hypothetical protein
VLSNDDCIDGVATWVTVLSENPHRAVISLEGGQAAWSNDPAMTEAVKGALAVYENPTHVFCVINKAHDRQLIELKALMPDKEPMP